MVNTENMNSLSALDHRIMEKFLSLVRRVHQLISRSDIGQQKYNWNLSPASSGEGSAVSAFPSDKVCEVVEKMKLMQCKQMKLIHTTEFFLLFYCFFRRKKKDNSKHVLLLLHSLLDRIFMMLTLLLFAEAGHWLGLNLRHYLWCYQRYWIRKLIDRILHFFSGMREERVERARICLIRFGRHMHFSLHGLTKRHLDSTDNRDRNSCHEIWVSRWARRR